MTTVAAFDFDGTLTRRDTVVPFLARFLGRRPALTGLMRQAPALLTALGRRDRDGLRSAATRALLTGLGEDAVDDRARAHAEHIIASGLRADTVERLRWHTARGHLVVIVSASYEIYVEPVAAHLGAAAVLATRLETSGGVLTGHLAGRNCRAAEKVVRVDAWLADHGLRRDDIELWVYGDSAGDRELLAAADHSLWAAGPIASVAPTP